ncbi:MAG: serine/threonine-protein phosphatase [Acidobacteria bacterium]|nr:serine/threonine-protein phosphatase [Acidobacteriota bacterium]
MGYRFGNAQHVGARQQQQDSFGFSDSHDESLAAHAGFLAVVADGMGGLAHGDAASRTAVRSFLQAYRSKTPDESISQALERSLREANLDVNTLASTLGQSGEMGTTLVAAVLHGEDLYWASCGDSAIFLHRDGELTLLNAQHVYARVLDERAARGELSAEAALGDPQREALTSHLGQAELEEIDVSANPFAVREGDTLLLASDGLFKTLPERDIAALVGSGDNVQAACERLVATVLARQRKGQDNVTVVAIGVGDAPVPVAPPPPEPVRDRASEALAARDQAARELTARTIVEARLAAAPPPPKIAPWKILVPALLFVLVVAAAGFFAWNRMAAPATGGSERTAGKEGFDTSKLPPAKPASSGKEEAPVEFEPLKPAEVEAPQPAAPPAQNKKKQP